MTPVTHKPDQLQQSFDFQHGPSNSTSFEMTHVSLGGRATGKMQQAAPSRRPKLSTNLPWQHAALSLHVRLIS